YPIVSHRLHYFTSSTLSLYMLFILFFFFNDTPPTEIYTLSLHDALPISATAGCRPRVSGRTCRTTSRASRIRRRRWRSCGACSRSEEHTSELQSLRHLVCRLLLEKKKKKKKNQNREKKRKYKI